LLSIVALYLICKIISSNAPAREVHIRNHRRTWWFLLLISC
jgi:hypothetical protein